MKKSFNINISGVIFHIDEDAYEKLNQYIERLKQHFAGEESSEEIVNDIEARIAELLREKLGEDKQVISLDDVEEVIAVMGEPAEMDEEEHEGVASEREPAGPGYDRPKRLFRDPDNKIIGGVGGGMGAYFNVDPLWFRLAFVVSFFAVGPLAYIIFWIAIPMARTTAEKLEMRGKRVNINNIERSVKEEFRDIGDSFSSYASRTRESFSRNKGMYRDAGDTIGDGIVEVLRVLLKIAAILIGIVLIITGLSLISAIIGVMFIPSIPFVLMDELPIYFSGPAFINLIFGDGLIFTLGVLGMALLIGIPLAWLVFIGLRLIFGNRIKTHYFDHNVLIVWVVALFVTGGSIFFTAKDFRHEQTIDKEVSSLPAGKASYKFDMTPDSWYPSVIDERKYLFSEVPENRPALHNSFRGVPGLSFKATDDSIGVIYVEYSSRGESPRDARRRAERIVYDIKIKDSTVNLDALFAIPRDDKFRMQDIEVIVSLAEGTRFTISDELDDIAYPWYINAGTEYVVKNGKILGGVEKEE
ncbi:MAG: PspC domain-containing protein [Bacteroidales bacterium]|nr:PspC domain-containing protein [Bacteroidales bacterium]